jgi:hypothetical protein
MGFRLGGGWSVAVDVRSRRQGEEVTGLKAHRRAHTERPDGKVDNHMVVVRPECDIYLIIQLEVFVTVHLIPHLGGPSPPASVEGERYVSPS